MIIEILYWHWIVFGVILVMSEVMLTSFFILWFGVAAILMGGVLYFFPQMDISWQIMSWTVVSSVLAYAWFKFLKPLAIDRTKAGLSREAIIGEIGQVIRVPTEENRGKLRFPAPILGSDEWLILSQDGLAEGDRVRVKDISGNALIVEKA